MGRTRQVARLTTGGKPGLLFSTTSLIPHPRRQPSPQLNGDLATGINWATLGSLLKSECSTDVELVFGVENIVFKAHKALLQLRAKQLANKVKAEGVMFSEVKRLFIPDVEHTVFRPFFEYLYTNEFLPSLTVGFSTEDFRKLINLFTQYCGKQILSKLVTPKTVFMLAKIVSNKELQKLTTEEVARLNKDAVNFLKTEDFLGMDSQNVAEMIKSDELNIDEFTLFNAVLLWATRQPNPDSRTLRGQMKNVFPFIRFPLMSVEEFYEVDGHGILTNDEVADLFRYLGAKTFGRDKPEYKTHATQSRTNIRQSQFQNGSESHSDLDFDID